MIVRPSDDIVKSGNLPNEDITRICMSEVFARKPQKRVFIGNDERT